GFWAWSSGARPAKSLTNRRRLLDSGHSGWGRSSVGRAPQWHCGGQGFESPRLHQPGIRKKVSAMTPEQRAEHFRRGMVKIYGGQRRIFLSQLAILAP